jgi:fused signal recognition particle receptor
VIAREIKPKVGLVEQLRGRLTGQLTLSESQLAPALDELELALLEADVDLDASAKIRKSLTEKLANKSIPAPDGAEKAIQRVIRETLLELLNVEAIDVLARIREKKDTPFVILFTGPNGAGKTTSMAKLTHYLNQNKISSIWSASDTFRAASIEQLEVHAKRLNVRLVKHAYGSDPAAVAFDAIAAAKAGKIDCVLLDSAGRQETNSNLMSELAKLRRVAKPDLTVFVGESYAGQSLLDMAREFNQTLGLDGLILTKLDTDPKGGTVLSLVIELQKPILFLGTGQEYNDWEKFDANKLIERIVGN